MKVREFLRKNGISVIVDSPEPRLAESYYKVKVKRKVRGFKKEQEVDVNDPTALGYTVTMAHPKKEQSVKLSHFTAPGVTTTPTGEEFVEFMVSAGNGGFPKVQPVLSNGLVLKVWLGKEKYSELMDCEV